MQVSYFSSTHTYIAVVIIIITDQNLPILVIFGSNTLYNVEVVLASALRKGGGTSPSRTLPLPMAFGHAVHSCPPPQSNFSRYGPVDPHVKFGSAITVYSGRVQESAWTIGEESDGNPAVVFLDFGCQKER